MDVPTKITSKVYLIRHGETDWSKAGKHTSRAEVPLSKTGEEQVIKARDHFIGEGKLIDPADISRIYCSPRGRARRTCELLNLGHHGRLLWEEETPETPGRTNLQTKVGTPVLVTERLREWDYGDYEGMTISEVHELRKTRGLDKDRENDGKTWNIWVDGCIGPSRQSDQGDPEVHGDGWTDARRQDDSAAQEHHLHCARTHPGLDGAAMGAAAVEERFEHDDIREPGIILGRRAGL
ncbi:Phosphoglycerate mutase family protein [Rasamsonia emersonii CBS 393.64]|uniref:Phosphoglycerate mutase family protein n=1 Tax=Rasamsonia emersonii (strain ATCC 16479 / CBS 393.64 / IMI 116815) TaxID=1408163 RepID=A0A0F4YSL7_RASE3|nr:Phosphoglycerate mutase family protein [Rasamsonia emersonii CBS 393.64]KKA21105.1 Phosphoglycerate mutase family protein [Rasamsonia emersonii CBS 393.64]